MTNSRLLNAMSSTNPEPTKTTTQNGAGAYVDTGNALVDLLHKLGNCRGESINFLVSEATRVDLDATIALLLHARDIRGGMAERDTPIQALAFVANKHLDVAQGTALIRALAELGRFKDLRDISPKLHSSVLRDYIITFWLDQIFKENNALAAKWVPVKDKKGARPFRHAAGLSEMQWRKAIVAKRNLVETLMSQGKWDEINFNHVPSRAMNTYYKAFKEHQPERFEAYLSALTKKTEGVKVNSATLFPYEIIRNNDVAMRDAQWDALPNYFEDEKENILCVVDTSGSMCQPANPEDSYSASPVSCLDVALSLGLYCSERINGMFKNHFITFSAKPTLQSVSGTLSQRLRQMERADWSMNTNIQAMFDLILDKAMRANLSHDDMPSKILIVSDMQFDACISGATQNSF